MLGLGTGEQDSKTCNINQAYDGLLYIYIERDTRVRVMAYGSNCLTQSPPSILTLHCVGCLVVLTQILTKIVIAPYWMTEWHVKGDKQADIKADVGAACGEYQLLRQRKSSATSITLRSFKIDLQMS